MQTMSNGFTLSYCNPIQNIPEATANFYFCQVKQEKQKGFKDIFLILANIGV